MKDRELTQFKNSKIETEIENDSLKKRIPKLERMLEEYKLKCMEQSAKLKEYEDKAKIQAGQLNAIDQIAFKINNSRAVKLKENQTNEKENIISKCEKVLKEKEKEVKSLKDKLEEQASVNVPKLKAEIQRLSRIIEESDQIRAAQLKEIQSLKGAEAKCSHIKLLEEAKDRETDLQEKIRVLQIMYKESEGKTKRIKEESNTKIEKIEVDSKHKVSTIETEISSLNTEISTIIKIIESALKGEEPNIKLMMGSEEQTVKHSNMIEECKEMKKSIKLARKKIMDYYAEKYTSDCNIQ